MYRYELYEPNTIANCQKVVYLQDSLTDGDRFQVFDQGKFTVYQYKPDSCRLHPLMPMQSALTVFRVLDIVEVLLEQRTLEVNGGIVLR